MKILILYTELAGYVLSNLRRFLTAHPEAEVLLVHYPVNPEAPFAIEVPERAEFILFEKDRQDAISKRIRDFGPGLVLCSGWGNRFYLNTVKGLDSKVKKVVCFDNQWKGTLKQWINVLTSFLYLLRVFRYAWVPGEPQRKYAARLGFRPENIHTGLYPADTDFFSAIGKKKLGSSGPYPRVMLSVARYIPQKDLPVMWRAFIAANGRTGNRWTLNCIGLGELFEQRIQDSHIFHLGFRQPAEMEEYILGAGVYVLPSLEEPWGVAVHEMALCALPLLLSDKVGAATMFLGKENGFSFKAGDEKELEERMVGMMNMSDEELRKMAEASFERGSVLLSGNWSDTLLSIYQSA